MHNYVHIRKLKRLINIFRKEADKVININRNNVLAEFDRNMYFVI